MTLNYSMLKQCYVQTFCIIFFYRNGGASTNASFTQGLVLPCSICHAVSTTASGWLLTWAGSDIAEVSWWHHVHQYHTPSETSMYPVLTIIMVCRIWSFFGSEVSFCGLLDYDTMISDRWTFFWCLKWIISCLCIGDTNIPKTLQIILCYFISHGLQNEVNSKMS